MPLKKYYTEREKAAEENILHTLPRSAFSFWSHQISFELYDGWYKIIHDLSQKIYDICKEKGYEIPIAIQVKEKFGNLRFYLEAGYDEVYDAIDEAEKLSEITCEYCGEDGKIRENHGWYRG